MKTKEDIVHFLLQAGMPHEEVSDGMWVVGSTDDAQKIVLKYAPPVLVARLNVMEVPEKHKEELFQTLLSLNATDMLHGAYGLEEGKIVIADALELENLDFNEFQAMIDDIALAV